MAGITRLRDNKVSRRSIGHARGISRDGCSVGWKESLLATTVAADRRDRSTTNQHQRARLRHLGASLRRANRGKQLGVGLSAEDLVCVCHGAFLVRLHEREYVARKSGIQAFVYDAEKVSNLVSGAVRQGLSDLGLRMRRDVELRIGCQSPAVRVRDAVEGKATSPRSGKTAGDAVYFAK